MNLIALLSDNPALRALQLMLLVAAVISVFLVLYTTRDVLQRSESFWFQLFAIVIVACMPIVGFLLYLLVRPAHTLWEKDLFTMLEKTTGTRQGGALKKREKEKQKEQSKPDPLPLED